MLLRDVAEVAYLAHNQMVVGSIPTPATTMLDKLYAKSLRDLLDMANAMGIKKSDYLQIVTPKDEYGYYLIYNTKTKDEG